MLRDFKIAGRLLLRNPAFTLGSVLTLGLAIAMATSVFSVIDAILLRPLPYSQPDRLAVLGSSEGEVTDSQATVSFADFEDWRLNSKALESAAAYTAYYKPILTGRGVAERLNALLVSHGYFAVMRAKPLLGRFFLAAEDFDGNDNEVVLSYQVWRDRFASDPHIVGRRILLNSVPHTVVGVARPDIAQLPPSLVGFHAQIYRPVGELRGEASRDGRHLETVVRLSPGFSIAQAQSELDVLCRNMERLHPDSDAHLRVRLRSLREEMTRPVRSGLIALQSAVLLVLLIACANIANLLLARSSARRREIVIRASLGAGAARLMRMLLAESLVVGLAGGVLGLLVTTWTIAALNHVATRVLPDAGNISIDPRILAFSAVLSVAAGLLFGAAPAWRIRSPRLDEALRSGTRVAGDQRNRMRQLLAAMQIALALMLLVGAGLLGRSFLRLRSVEPGFDPKGILAGSVALPQARYSSDSKDILFFDRVLAKLRRVPGVRHASMVSVVPISGDFDKTAFVIPGKHFRIEDEDYPDRYIVSPEYFATMRIPLRKGRLFDPRDDQNHAPVAVISETAAHLWFPGESPIGKKIRAGGTDKFEQSPFREIVGVVGDVAQYGLGLPPTPQVYMPHSQFVNRYMTILLRTDGDPESFAEPLRKAVFAADPEQPVYDVVPLEEIVSNSIATRRFGVWLLVLFAVGALALASVGIYGVVSYSMAQRTSEFGIRLALGAEPGNIVTQALRENIPVIAFGLAVGIVCSLAASRLLARFLFGVSSTDALTFAVLPLFLALVAVCASYMPARRAGKTDPLIALRYE